MSKTKSFWVWFQGRIGEILGGLLRMVYECWYGVLIGLGTWGTIAFLGVAWMEYSWPSYVWVGDVYQRVEPIIKPWMILYPTISFVVFMIGLYGYWRKSIRNLGEEATTE